MNRKTAFCFLFSFLFLISGRVFANDVNISLSTNDGSTALSVRNGAGAEVAKIDSTGRIRDVSGFLVPVAAVMSFAIPAAPAGWLSCDGSAVSRTAYADLFAAIGTMYGAGDGTTTFNLPDYRGRFLRARDNGALNDPDALSRLDRGDGTTGDAVGTQQYIGSGSGGGGLNYQVFNSSGTWQRPAGVNRVRLMLLGGGAGGGGSNQWCAFGGCSAWTLGSGGQGGSQWNGIIDVSEASYAVTIGAGGTGGLYTNTMPWPGIVDASIGGDGGSTSFGSEVTVIGGKGIVPLTPEVASIPLSNGAQSSKGLATRGQAGRPAQNTTNQDIGLGGGSNGGDGAQSNGTPGSPGGPGLCIVMWEGGTETGSGGAQPNNISVLYCIKH